MAPFTAPPPMAAVLAFCSETTLILSAKLALALSIKCLRIGSNTNFAAMAAAIVIDAETMNALSQLPPADSTEARGTSREAVPFAVYSVPALPAANLTPKVSAQIAGKIEKISPQNRKVKAAKVM